MHAERVRGPFAEVLPCPSRSGAPAPVPCGSMFRARTPAVGAAGAAPQEGYTLDEPWVDDAAGGAAGAALDAASGLAEDAAAGAAVDPHWFIARGAAAGAAVRAPAGAAVAAGAAMTGPEPPRAGLILMARQADRMRKAAGRATLSPPCGPVAEPLRPPRGSVGRLLQFPPPPSQGLLYPTVPPCPPPPSQGLLYPTVPPRWDGPRPPAFPPPPALLLSPPVAAPKGKVSLPAYLKHHDTGIRPKSAVLPEARPSKRPRVEAAGAAPEADPPLRQAAVAGKPSVARWTLDDDMSGSQLRRMKRHCDALLLGREGLMRNIALAAQAAAVETARSSGLISPEVE